MGEKIPTGPYVIRNKCTSTVLHIKDLDLPQKSSSVLGAYQDDNHYREQQIWWIEPLPGSEDNPAGEVSYSITNICAGKSLDLNLEIENGLRKASSKDCKPITAHRTNEAPWQKWKIETIEGADREDKTYYKLASAWNGHILDLWGRPAPPGACCFAAEYVHGYDQHCWELVIPIIAFPPGWFQIQNAETGDLLSHAYRWNPPVLVKPSVPVIRSQYRESWGTQWSLTLAETCCPQFKSTTGANLWCIRNRLTGGFLGNMGHRANYEQVVSGYFWGFSLSEFIDHFWKLEIDPICNTRWKVIHFSTGSLLERTADTHHGGIKVVCGDNKLPRGNKDKTWCLTSPYVEDVEEVRFYPGDLIFLAPIENFDSESVG